MVYPEDGIMALFTTLPLLEPLEVKKFSLQISKVSPSVKTETNNIYVLEVDEVLRFDHV